jgi:hypothetical protein
MPVATAARSRMVKEIEAIVTTQVPFGPGHSEMPSQRFSLRLESAPPKAFTTVPSTLNSFDAIQLELKLIGQLRRSISRQIELPVGKHVPHQV